MKWNVPIAKLKTHSHAEFVWTQPNCWSKLIYFESADLRFFLEVCGESQGFGTSLAIFNFLLWSMHLFDFLPIVSVIYSIYREISAELVYSKFYWIQFSSCISREVSKWPNHINYGSFLYLSLSSPTSPPAPSLPKKKNLFFAGHGEPCLEWQSSTTKKNLASIFRNIVDTW